jgi:c-di-GMP-binding flagellar brake protein YcgR
MAIENRRYQRLDIAIEVRVRGKDKSGRPFAEDTLSGDISSGGCSLLLSCDVAVGSELEMEFLRHVPGKQEPMSLAFRGTVVRTTPVNKIQYTMGIQFLNDLFPIDALKT